MGSPSSLQGWLVSSGSHERPHQMEQDCFSDRTGGVGASSLCVPQGQLSPCGTWLGTPSCGLCSVFMPVHTPCPCSVLFARLPCSSDGSADQRRDSPSLVALCVLASERAQFRPKAATAPSARRWPVSTWRHPRDLVGAAAPVSAPRCGRGRPDISVGGSLCLVPCVGVRSPCGPQAPWALGPACAIARWGGFTAELRAGVQP